MHMTCDDVDIESESAPPIEYILQINGHQIRIQPMINKSVLTDGQQIRKAMINVHNNNIDQQIPVLTNKSLFKFEVPTAS
jgi:hypothetical protein